MVIDSLIIKRFKLFDELTVPKLSRLNLFVGSNNTGKSCLLEAVRLFATEASPAAIRDLVQARDGDLESGLTMGSNARENHSTSYPSPIWHLFRHFGFGSANSVIEIGSSDSEKQLRIFIGVHKRETPGLSALYGTEDDSLLGAEEMLEVFKGADRIRFVKLDSLFIKPLFGLRYAVDGLTKTRVVMVGTDGLNRSEIGVLWDRINLTPWQDKVIDCLRLIEPRIEGIALLGNMERKAVLRLRGAVDRVPLKSMGDGLTRLFHIALAMVNAEDGIILIDEFENGLYWEVQEQLWPVVFQMAESLNVQVFATSHSNDCVRGFMRAWADCPELGTMYRLERTDSSVNAFELPMENLSDALDSLVEVR